MKMFTSIKRVSALGGILLISYSLYPQSADNKKVLSDSLIQSRELDEVIVKGVRVIGKDRIGAMSISGIEINKQPVLFGEHDVIKALQTTAGVVSGTEGFAGLYVRGGETDQNLYLLDGLPLLNVYHFGGLFSTFSTYSIDNVDFYKGAFPSLFGERVSSIVNIGLKRPDYNKTTGIFSIGLISGQLYFSTPIKKGKSALSIALRRTWFDVLSAPVLAIINSSKKSEGKKSIFQYNFTDMLIKFSAMDRRGNDMSLLLFYGKDNFKLGDERFDPDNSKLVYQKDINKMSWGNWGAAFTYRLSTPIGDIKILPFVSKAFSTDSQENMDDSDHTGGLTALTKINPSVLQIGMREMLSFPIINGLEGEVGLQQIWYDYNLGNPSVSYSEDSLGTTTYSFPNHSKNVLLLGFGEFYWNIANCVQGAVGLRVNHYISRYIKHWNLDPRLNIKINLPYKSSLSIGYSRMTQYAQQVSSNYMYLPSDAWFPTASYNKPLLCDIYSIGYFKRFKHAFNIKAELWWKNMRNLTEYKTNTRITTTMLPWYEKMTFGKGCAYGLDLEMVGSFKSLHWNVAYGLMWNWRQFNDINSGKRYPAKFDNRNKFDITIGWNINDKIELTGQWEYMTGNRATLSLYNVAPPDVAFPDAPFVSPLDPDGGRQDGIDYYEGRNNVQLPAFHRLNLNLSFKGRINNRLTYQWDFGLYNAYCRMNPFTVIKSYVNTEWDNNEEYRKFKTLSLIPILPSVSYTLNF